MCLIFSHCALFFRYALQMPLYSVAFFGPIAKTVVLYTKSILRQFRKPSYTNRSTRLQK